MPLERALALHRQGNIDQAKSLYEQILQTDPEHAFALHMLGLAHYQRGEAATAREYVGRSLELDPDNIGIMTNLATILASLGQFQEAVTTLEQALEREPDQAQIWQTLGDRLAESDRAQEAADAYAKADALWPEGTDKGALPLNLAASLAEAGRYDQAVAQFRDIVRSEPDNPIAHCNLGFCLQETGAIAEACQAFRSALRVQPDMFEVRLGLAKTLEDLDDLDEALVQAQKAREIRPGETSWFREGHVRQELGQGHEARACYNEALRYTPGSSVVLNNMAVLALNEGDLDEAAHWIQHAIGQDPGYAEAWINQANILEKQGRLEEAETAAANAVQIHETPAALVRLGYILQRQERLEAALEIYSRALEIDPEDSKGVTLYLAALGLRTMPQRAPRVLVQKVFDFYAANYDQHMCDILEYRGPDIILGLLSPYLQELDMQDVSLEGLDILDLGCGTGLCGAALAAFAKRMDGIDLSQRMLAKAQKRGIYTMLTESELTSALQTSQHTYDCVTACDVFVYLGDLTPVFHGVQHCLRPGGLFAFTVERQNTPGYQVDHSTRYRHSREYLEELSRTIGFDILAMENTVLRQERQEPVDGLGVLLRRQ